MSPADFNQDRVSEEELRDLLGEDLVDAHHEAEERGAGGASAVPSGPRCLLVTRHPQDRELVGGRLRSHGAIVEIVRNAFAALDKLRTGSFAAVITDLDLWADEARLLRERLAADAGRIPVLYILESRRGDETERLTRRLGAWGMLARPLDPRNVEATCQALIETSRTGATSETLAAASASVLDMPPGWDPGTVRLRERESLADARAPGLSSREPAPESVSTPEAACHGADYPWLRFLHAAMRMQRRGQWSAEGLARLARSILAAEAVSLQRFAPDGYLTISATTRKGPRRSTELDYGNVAEDEASAWRLNVASVNADMTCVLTGLPEATRAVAGEFREDLEWLLVCLLEGQ